jgi:cytochrome c oxidase subunit III
MSTTTTTPVEIHAVPEARQRDGVKARSAAEGASRSGIWVAMFAITMSFAALTSALFVREGSAGDWQRIALPPILYANTLALLASSLTLSRARHAVNARSFMNSRTLQTAMVWLVATFALGLLFIAGQYQAWRQLAAHGLFLSTNPNSSFFYVFTGVHILHLAGGLAALVYLIGQLAGSHSAFRRVAFDNTAVYWHFMSVLWLYLLLVMRAKI